MFPCHKRRRKFYILYNKTLFTENMNSFFIAVALYTRLSLKKAQPCIIAAVQINRTASCFCSCYQVLSDRYIQNS